MHLIHAQMTGNNAHTHTQVVVDSGFNIYILDSSHGQRICTINAAWNFSCPTAWVSGTPGAWAYAGGIALDKASNLYVSDGSNAKIFIVSGNNGSVSCLVTANELYHPAINGFGGLQSIAVDANFNAYVATPQGYSYYRICVVSGYNGSVSCPEAWSGFTNCGSHGISVDAASNVYIWGGCQPPICTIRRGSNDTVVCPSEWSNLGSFGLTSLSGMAVEFIPAPSPPPSPPALPPPPPSPPHLSPSLFVSSGNRICAITYDGDRSVYCPYAWNGANGVVTPLGMFYF